MVADPPAVNVRLKCPHCVPLPVGGVGDVRVEDVADEASGDVHGDRPDELGSLWYGAEVEAELID